MWRIEIKKLYSNTDILIYNFSPNTKLLFTSLSDIPYDFAQTYNY